MMVQIHLYPNSFLDSQKENKWTDTRLNAQIAHTIAHEIYNRDTGESVDYDHAA